MRTRNILITGGTGFIGRYLSSELMKAGHLVTVVTRSPGKYKEEQAKNQQFISWEDDLAAAMEQMDVVVNLAGENLFGKRWTKGVKKKIYDSRIQSTRKLTDAIGNAESKPELFISGSGISIYGDGGDSLLDESSPAGKDFLARICIDWEKEANKANEYGVRVVNPRIGIVLGKQGGFLKIMKVPFKLLIGGPVGSGQQYVPWIHLKDLCETFFYAMENEEITGPYNACSPHPETMAALSKSLGTVLNRPSFFKVPEFFVKLLLGEASKPALSSLRVQPKVLQISGFKFEFEDLEEALADIL